MRNKKFNADSKHNLGNDLLIVESLCNDRDKPYLRAYWEYKTQSKEDAIKKYPHWAEQFAIDNAGETSSNQQ